MPGAFQYTAFSPAFSVNAAHDLAGSASTSCLASASLDLSVVLAGEAATACTASADLALDHALASSVSASFTVGGWLDLSHAAGGSAYTICTAVGDLILTKDFAGDAAFSFAVQADVLNSIDLAGSAAFSFSVPSAALERLTVLAGETSAAYSVADAVLNKTDVLAAEVSVDFSTADAECFHRVPLAGTSACSPNGEGTLTKQADVAGSSAFSFVVATSPLSTTKTLYGRRIYDTSSNATLNGLPLNSGLLNGGAIGVDPEINFTVPSTLLGYVHNLSGAAAAAASVWGTVEVIHNLEGSAGANFGVTGTLRLSMDLGGQVSFTLTSGQTYLRVRPNRAIEIAVVVDGVDLADAVPDSILATHFEDRTEMTVEVVYLDVDWAA